MLLNELFNKILPYHDAGGGTYNFKSRSGKSVEVQISTTETSEVLVHDPRGTAFCEFIQAQNPEAFESLTPGQVIKIIDEKRPFNEHDAGAEVAFDKDGGFGITADEDGPLEIFATVLEIMKKHLVGSHYYFVHFSASEPTRKTLYRRMARILSKGNEFTHVFEPVPGKYFLFHPEFFRDFHQAFKNL